MVYSTFKLFDCSQYKIRQHGKWIQRTDTTAGIIVEQKRQCRVRVTRLASRPTNRSQLGIIYLQRRKSHVCDINSATGESEERSLTRLNQ